MLYALHYDHRGQSLCVTNFNEQFELPKFLLEQKELGTCLFFKEIPKWLDMPWLHVYDIDFKKPAFSVNQERLHASIMNRIRTERDSALGELDNFSLRFVTDSKKMEEVENIKQELRDLPTKIDLSRVKTISEAENVTPPILETYKIVML